MQERMIRLRGVRAIGARAGWLPATAPVLDSTCIFYLPRIVGRLPQNRAMHEQPLVRANW